MEAVFLKILNMSINAGWLVLAVLAVRLILKKAPKSITVLLWALVGIRLLCPFTLESALSLLPSGETVSHEILSAYHPKIQSGVPVIDEGINMVLDRTLEPAQGTVPFETPVRAVVHIGVILWLTGAALMLLYAAISYLRVRYSVREGMHTEDGLWLCDRISGPFILGIFHPRIYLPSSMETKDLQYVTEHENAHLKRKDHWWKPLGFLLLCIHWFNPLLWLGYIFLCSDIELACDEAVLRKLGMESKKPYSETLLHCSISKRTLSACPLAFGEVGIKPRIKSVLRYKKPALWIIPAAALVCAMTAICFLTDPIMEISPAMDYAVGMMIKDRHYPDTFIYRYATVSEYEILGMKKRGNTTTLYLSAMYQEYSAKDHTLNEKTACHTPAVITLVQNDGFYLLEEYWEPEHGTAYVGDVQEKFPQHLWDEALDTGRYAQKLEESCKEQAQQRLFSHALGNWQLGSDVWEYRRGRDRVMEQKSFDVPIR